VSISGKIRALRRKVEERGPAGAIALALRTLVDATFRRDEILFVRSLQAAGPRAAEGTDQTGVRPIRSIDDLSAADRAALAAYGGPGYLRTAEERIRSGWTLFLVDLGGTLAGGGWALTPATGLVSKVVPLLEGDVTIIDCFTFPERRGRGAYPGMLEGIAHHYGAQGCLRAFIFTRASNTASVRGIEKAGFVPVAVYWTLALGGGELVWWRRRAGRTREASA
jgi:hypothetical protein